MKHEASFNSYFNKWLKNVHKKTGAYELKQTKGNSLPFDAVVPHQVAALLQVKHGVFVFKIPDAGYQNPYDCYSMVKQPAYVVIKYPDFFCLIDIDDWVVEEGLLERRSLTSSRAREISTVVVEL